MSDKLGTGRNAGSRGSQLWSHLVWPAAMLVFVVVAGAVIWAWRGHGMLIKVSVDGYAEQVRTTRPDVRGLLTDLGLTLRSEDLVDPLPDTPLSAGMVVTIQRARLGQIAVDGAQREVYSRAATVDALLADAGIHRQPNDEVWLEGQQVKPDALLPVDTAPAGKPRFALTRAWVGHEPKPVRLSLRRAVPVTVDDGVMRYEVFTTAPTLGEALLREDVTLYLGDRVQPSLGSRVHSGMHVLIQRSKSVVVSADGRTLRTRTRGEHVGDALTELGIMVEGSDRVSPAMGESVEENEKISITRVRQTMLVESQSIPFESKMVGDENLEIDQQAVTQVGHEGEFRKRWQIVYEDGVEKSRRLIDAWMAVEPVTHITAYGQKIVSRPLDTPEGSVTYWRKVSMYATSYSAATAGVSPSSPSYGRTRLGLPMRFGLVAVDPSLIPLGSRIYVQGYGIGLAADTGGGIRSRMIDLGYDDNNLVHWSRWVDVYLLDPAPSRSGIRWLLPNWPQQ